MAHMEKDWDVKICLIFCSLAATYSNDLQNFTKDGFSWQNSFDIFVFRLKGILLLLFLNLFWPKNKTAVAVPLGVNYKTSSSTRKNPWETLWASTEKTVDKERPKQPLDIHAIHCTEIYRLFLAEYAKEEAFTSW